MATRTGAAFELQRLHGMGEGIYAEVLKDASACRVYLLRFCTEQTLTVNTTAAGGNVQLLA
jgi:delta 1-pyrroline-5-carboxylate dehydrogenase